MRKTITAKGVTVCLLSTQVPERLADFVYAEVERKGGTVSEVLRDALWNRYGMDPMSPAKDVIIEAHKAGASDEAQV